MPYVFLIQHAEAKSEEEDPERRITDKGREETEKIAEFLKRVGIEVDKVYHSTKTRAKQTAEIIAKKLGVEAIEAENLEPLADPKIWAEKLRDIEENVIIVGHLPHLSKLLTELTGSKEEVVKFRYSGVVCLERENGNYKILWFVRPDII